MRIVVAYKWAANPQDATVGGDGSVLWERAKATVSEYDPVAIEVGRQLANATGGELIGISVGGKDVGSSLARKGAMSRGFDRAVILADDAILPIYTLKTAAYLAAIVKHIGDVDVVLTGDSSVDVGAKLVPPALAGELGWPCVSEVTKVSGTAGDLTIERAFAGGTQVLHADGPVVLAAATDAAVAPIPGMKDILAASKKPVEEVSAADLDLPQFASALETVGRSKAQLKARKGQIIVADDPDAAATALVTALRADNVL